MARILIVDDEEFLREELQRILGEEGYQVDGVENGAAALEYVKHERADLVLLDLNLPDVHGIDVLRELKAKEPQLLVIVVTGYGSVESAVESLKLGAYDYIKKPFKADAIKLIVKLALETKMLRHRVEVLKKSQTQKNGIVVAQSIAFSQIMEQARDVAFHPETTVLITGESGTGKEVVARTIHNLSERRSAPFLEINCASIPGAMLESELFGYEAGAFTDARKSKEGLLESADGGTVFLDEIGDMDPGLQAKLLSFLELRAFRRLGGVKNIRVDVRIVAATNSDLNEAIETKSFREDLFFRLNVFPIRIPPLRERNEDVIPLATAFLEQFARNSGRGPKAISDEAALMLQAHPWPGNVREVRNLMERMSITCKADTLRPEHLPPEFRGQRSGMGGGPMLPPEGCDLKALEAELATALIAQALERTGGNLSKAAKLLNLPRGTLRNRMESLGMEVRNDA